MVKRGVKQEVDKASGVRNLSGIGMTAATTESVSVVSKQKNTNVYMARIRVYQSGSWGIK